MTHQLPFVSIVMPVRNEEAFIERSLGSALQQDYPAERIEILVADGMSDDRTVEIIRSMPGAERVRVIENPERIQSCGLNRAIPLAKGDYIIRLDGHTILTPDYVSRCVELLKETGADNVGGAMNPVGITPMGKVIAVAGKSPFAVPTAFHVSDKPQYTDTVYLGAFPRHVFERIGLYNTAVGVNEDYEFNYRIRELGGKVYFSPEIKSLYYGRQTIRELARQYYRYGRSKIQTLRLHPKSLRPRQIVAPLFVAGLFVGWLLGLIFPLFGLLWLAGVGTYAVFNICFALRATRKTPDVPFWQVSAVFFVMHCAWGLGFWRELVRPGAL